MTGLGAMRIVVLAGGSSPEREVSLLSGATVLDALRAQGCDARLVDPATADWWQQLAGVDLAFIALHGAGGEDGVMQGALQTLRVPYTGSGVLASALAMDKLRTKQLWQAAGLPVAPCEVLHADGDFDGVIARLGKVFVKPATGGSSIGMAPAATAAELAAAFINARQYDETVLAEQFVAGPEYTVAILGDRALPAIRLETDNVFYDYHAKYLSETTRYLCPAGLSVQDEDALGALCLSAFRALGAAVWGRLDVMRVPGGGFVLLELNTVPGMTSHSLVPMAARQAGLGIEQLVAEIAERSLTLDRGGHA
jgi:D-alanine-D-alanine ligase